MGDTSGMDQKDNIVTLYTSQRNEVVNQIEVEGIYWAKMQFIREKYGEVAHLFLGVYQWYNQYAPQYVPKPSQAESGIWAFASRGDVSPYEGCKILTLQVPIKEAVFFDMLEWSDLLNYRYLGSKEAEREFYTKLKKQGIAEPMQIVTTPFYPLLKRELQASWSSLFRYHKAIQNREPVPVQHIQAGLWQIKKEWVVAVE